MPTVMHVFDNVPHHFVNFMAFFCGACASDSVKVDHVVYLPLAAATSAKQLEALGCEVHFFAGFAQLAQLLAEQHNTGKILLHSVSQPRLWLAFFKRNLLPRCHWICWGADVYQYLNPNLPWKRRVAKCLLRYFVARLAAVQTLNPGDANIVKRLFKARRLRVLPYPLVDVNPSAEFNTSSTSARILLGNSAAASNHHAELLHRVKHLRGQSVEVVVPLNYAQPNQAYVDSVVQLGKQLLGEQFVPVLDMLDKKAYDALLDSVDATIFAHERQQGLYVAYYMMLQGKKLFLKSDTSTYENFDNLGFHIHTVDELPGIDAAQLLSRDEQVQVRNRRIFFDNFSETALAPKWQQLFQQM